MSLRIRPYQTVDRSSCLAVFRSNLPRFFAPEEEKDFADYLDRYGHTDYWVIEEAGHILGSGGIVLRDASGRGGFCWGLIDATRHRQGLGRALAQFRLLKLLERPALKSITLDTMQHNPGFFERLGFRLTKTTENYYGAGYDRLDMELTVPEGAERDTLVLSLQNAFRQSQILIQEPHMRRLYLASQNKHKVAELQAMLGESFDVRACSELAPDISWNEDGLTFPANARIKADTVLALGADLVLADDSGLEVLALGGRPGIHSARYAGETATDEDNNRKLLKELSEVPDDSLEARFVCVLCLKDKNGKEEFFEGICEGRLKRRESGLRGFGYDPLFVPAGHDETFAELGDAVKNRISHRALAMAKLKAHLAAQR